MAGKAILTCRPTSHLFQERTLILDHQPVKIGRSVARARPSANNGIFDCKVLSRNHALFWFHKGKFFLQDTKSSNGTFVNNQRLSRSGEESAPTEVCSGDIVQFGVDVLESTRKVTHGCIIANLKLYLPDGKEAKTTPASSGLSSYSVPVEDLYELHQYLQEATQREHMLETKLVALQEVLKGIKDAADEGWKALIAEDRLLTRVEALENQLQVYSKNFGEDRLKDEIVKLQEEKNQYQCTAKEFLKKVLDEKLEAVQKCQEVKRSLANVEAAYANLTEEMGRSQASIQELAHKLSVQLVKNEDTEMKLQELESKHKETVERLENRNKELEKMLAMRHAAEESLEKQLTDLQLAENIANEKAIAYEIQLKAFNDFSGKEDSEFSEEKTENEYISSKEEHKLITPMYPEENKDNEVHELLTAQLDLLQADQRARMPKFIEDQKASSSDEDKVKFVSQTLLVPIKEMESCSESFDFDKSTENGKGTLNGGIKESEEIESDISDAKDDSELKDSDESCDTSFSASSDPYYKEILDQFKFDLLNKRSGTLAQEKNDKTHKNFEDSSVITQVLKEQNKVSNQFNNENFESDDDTYQASQNKKNQEQDENVLRREESELKESDESRDSTLSAISDPFYKEILDQLKIDLVNKRSGTLAQEKLDKAHKNFDDSTLLKEQNKVSNQFDNENLKSDDTFQTSQNKKNQEQDENALRRQLLEAQQAAKQSRNEQAQLMDRIIALTTELESKNISQDNKIREKLFETQQECNKLQSTISNLQSELMSLKEKHNKMEEERIFLLEKLESFKSEKGTQSSISEKQYEDLTMKVSKLQEELLIVSSKYMSCNEERTLISQELTNLMLDYQAISHQPYFNLLFALPCIVLILAVTIVFYPTLSQIMGTAEHPEDHQSP